MDEEREGRGFRVTDRRRFAGGEPAAVEPAETPAPPVETPPITESAAPVTFATFVLGLSTQALLHLGEIADPATGTPARDLGAAKHVIDILGILEDKTRNNLESSETDMLDAMLYDLRVRYVELVRGEPGKESK